MKIHFGASILFLVGSVLAHSGQAIVPVFEETFDQENDKIRYVNGAGRGAPSTGVSGKVADRAYISTPKTTEQDTQSPAGYATKAFAPSPMEAFTVTFWYLLEEQTPELQVPLSFGSGTILLHRHGFEVRVGQSSGKDLQFVPGVKGPILDWTTAGRWILTAITWEQATNTMTFHQGTHDQVVTFMRDMKRPLPAEPATPRKNLDRVPEVIGNMHARGDRPLAGRLDNIRIYNRALNQQEIESIRFADTANLAPEIR